MIRPAALLVFLVLAACGSAEGPRRSSARGLRAQETANEAPRVRPQRRAASTAAVPGAAAVRLKLATFNIQVFGPSKASNGAVMRELAAVIRKYDLVAVQEVKDSSGAAPRKLLALVNAGHAGADEYAVALSPRTGREPDDRSSQEQYAYFFRTDRVRLVGEAVLFDDSAHDYFQREPYLSRFEVAGTGVDFVMINVHTKPTAALEEIAAIEHVFAWAKGAFVGEDTFIAVGDFNAGCGYASEEALDALPVHGEQYDWVVPHSADTNLAASQCPYDRIVIAAPGGNHVVEHWGVDQAFKDKLVSDHWPVWVELTLSSTRRPN